MREAGDERENRQTNKGSKSCGRAQEGSDVPWALLLYPAELNPEFSPACSHSRKMSVEGEKQLGLMNIRETETTDPISTYRLSWSP